MAASGPAMRFRFTHYQYAVAILAGRASGTSGQAVEQAMDACALAESVGMRILRERIDVLLAARAPDMAAQTASASPRPDDASSTVDGLTAREVEILAHLAGDASNAEIAQTLHLTRGTVHWYTVRIYQKIGVKGRAEAAAYAARHGLLAERA